MSTSTTAAAPGVTAQKRNFNGVNIAPSKKNRRKPKQHNPNKKRKLDNSGWTEGSHEEVLAFDIQALLAAQSLSDGPPTSSAFASNTSPTEDPTPPLPDLFTELAITITAQSSTGDGLGTNPTHPSQIFVVPYTTPGDTALAKIIRHVPFSSPSSPAHTITDFIRTLTPSPARNDALIKCTYFSSCSGCQLQMLPYAAQLQHKRSILERAYANFSGLPADKVPQVQETVPSPLQYGYRTKLTPHFDGPPGARRDRKKEGGARFTSVPNIGFMKKGQRKTLDIEDCPIGTEAVRRGVKDERERVARELAKYKRGATLLVRETTVRVREGEEEAEALQDLPRPKEQCVRVEGDGYVDYKTYITDSNATSTEYIDDYVFSNPAGSFFQNNNSILPVFTEYVRSVVLPPARAEEEEEEEEEEDGKHRNGKGKKKQPKIQNLIDAYSGSGLFTITLRPLFTSSTGIDISASSIASARRNLLLNSAHPQSYSTSALSAATTTTTTTTTTPNPSETPQGSTPAHFISADATSLFTSIPYPPLETVIIIDPPRKGCDLPFLHQLRSFGARRIVYVSCNVHTQARDVGFLVGGGSGEGRVEGRFGKGKGDEGEVGIGEVEKEEEEEREEEEEGGARYEIETLRGFDFFPQTGHVEGVCVLNRVF